MIKPVLKDSMKLFGSLGTVKSRSMFGGFGIFVDETMFALVVNDQLHIRGDKESEQRFKQQGFEPYVYKKRGFPVVTKYFSLPEHYWNDTDDILNEATLALAAAKEDKQQQATAKPTRLKDLPNLRLATERMLKKAGIESVDELELQGSLNAYRAICDSQGSSVSLELLWALEGAINRTHWSVVPKQRRDELLDQLN
ncbi:TfoX/Sxy family DNA transformation protein [Vibrio maerlii]|uniref:TfoX/Sxy family DNA transformation protein n=1 Tax=Vibrio maerlii TaxID=2231648 RepID=UPI000E3C6853|nr:TfoX/Sxy family DNA transformation protein [Vibrio maerlii]